MRLSPLDAVVTVARALGHPARLRTLAMLQHGELCVCQITTVLELAPSTVSAHLRELRRAGLTAERKEGRWVWVRLSDDSETRPWIERALANVSTDRQTASDMAKVTMIKELPVEEACRAIHEPRRTKNPPVTESTRPDKGDVS